MRLKAFGSALLLGWTFAAVAQEAKPAAPPAEAPAAPTTPPAAPAAPAPAAAAPQFKFEMHGFVSGSSYIQNQNLGPSEGQQALFVNPQTVGSGATQVLLPQPSFDKYVYGADVRQSRFNFSVAGPKVFWGATPKAVLEIDFFGGFGSGNYGNASLSPRLRLAYGELNWGAHRLAFGQQNDLIFAIAPTSLAHIAFPFGYAAGNIGWRRPGIWGFHTADLGGGLKAELAWEIARATWADSGSTGAATTGNGIGQQTVGSGGDKYGFSLGEASNAPALEARLTVSQGANYSAFVTGHWHRVDRTGVSGQVATPGSSLTVAAVNAGAKAIVGPLTVAATGFTGENLAPLIGNFLQFQANTAGPIHEMGGWVQAGFNFTKELSLWAFLGTDKPNEDEAQRASDRVLRNTTAAGMLQYRDGGYALGLEWIRFMTKTRVYANAGATPPIAGSAPTSLHGDQVMLSGNYFF